MDQATLDDIVFNQVNAVIEIIGDFLYVRTKKQVFTFEYEKPLGNGAQCYVYAYKDIYDKILKFAVKKCHKGMPDERAVSVHLNTFSYTVKQLKIDTDTYIMQCMDNDLEFIMFNHKLNTATKIAIVESIRQCLVGLHRNGFFYSDVKPNNVLYRTIGKKTKFVLGDIGSVLMNESGEYLSTFPPPETYETPGFIKDTDTVTKERMLSWFLGIIQMCLFDHAFLPSLHYKQVHNDKSQARRTFIMKKYAPYLNAMPEQRKSIFDPFTSVCHSDDIFHGNLCLKYSILRF
jgi:serine/threonine protein kinase